MAHWRDAVNAQALEDLLALYAPDAAFRAVNASDWVNTPQARRAYFTDDATRPRQVVFESMGSEETSVGSQAYFGTYNIVSESGAVIPATYLFNVAADPETGEERITHHVSRPVKSADGSPAEAAWDAYDRYAAKARAAEAGL